MSEQVEELRTATELQWRPFLLVDDLAGTFEFASLSGETADSARHVERLTGLHIDTPEWYAVKWVRYYLSRPISTQNTGSTPLRIVRVTASALSEDEWVSKYQSKVETLVDSLGGLREPGPFDEDIVVLPGNTWGAEKAGTVRKMPKDIFLEYLRRDTVVLYPYIFIEYMDLFGHNYNVLRMSRFVCACTVIDGQVSVDTKSESSEHVYRWDVGLR